MRKHGEYFEPYDLVLDNAGPLRNGITKVFGLDMPQVLNNFHFRQNAIGSNRDKAIFLRFISHLTPWDSPSVYMVILPTLNEFTFQPQSEMPRINLKKISIPR